jgi:hypothetical protein
LANPLSNFNAQFSPFQPVKTVTITRDPTIYDSAYPLSQEWLNPDTQRAFKLVDISSGLATWEQINNTVFQLNNGQLQIGSTGLPPVNSTLTAGSNVTITNGAGSITISAANPLSPQSFNVVTSSQSLAPNQCYFVNAMSSVDLTLPVTMQAGYVIEILGQGAMWTVKQNANQTIRFHEQNTTTGVTGQLASVTAYDCVTLRCVVDNTLFIVHPCTGNLDLT